MSNEEFTEYAITKIRKSMQEKYPEAEVEICAVRRNNRYRENSIIFRMGDSELGIAMALKDLHALNKSDVDLDESLSQLQEEVESALQKIPEKQLELDWNDCVEDLVATFVQKEEAIQFQEEFPCRQFQDTDIYIFYGLWKPDEKGDLPLYIDKYLMGKWGVNEAELYDTAITNLTWDKILMNALIPLRNTEKPVEFDIYLEEARGFQSAGIFYKLTAVDSPCGATVLLIPGLLEKLNKQFGEGFMIVPLSDQEVLLFSIEETLDYVRSAISMYTSIRKEEILSSKIYECKNGELRMLPWEWTGEISPKSEIDLEEVEQ